MEVSCSGEEVARVYFQKLISAIDSATTVEPTTEISSQRTLLLDEEGNLKVADFSLNSFTKHLKQDGLLHTTCGTLAYVAPEVIGKKGYDGAKALWVVQV
ncbi:hypothetical protein ACB098_11G066600 [Castanea mollissima]|uniref:Protein kinase domain-containing protein n=1 Tax=Castanea mollissima TaxID=60419 RepID=A0A8J4VKT3_9ROSI|nr:hypothetical protein CMV_014677 [Castanea mollissima]